MESSLGSVLELLVLKNAAQRTSQSVKWTSGARVVIFVLPRSLGRSLDRSLDRSIARSPERSLDRTLDRRWLGRLLARSMPQVANLARVQVQASRGLTILENIHMHVHGAWQGYNTRTHKIRRAL